MSTTLLEETTVLSQLTTIFRKRHSMTLPALPQSCTEVTIMKVAIIVGIGLSLSNYENYQVYGVLRGGEYTHSRLENVGGSKVLSAGSNVVLAAAVQGRNNARVIITGSLDLFSNELYAKR
jgi:Oligosaccharyltransferase 48 kDa subunit beta